MAMNTTKLPLRLTSLIVLLVGVALIPPEQFGHRPPWRGPVSQDNPFDATRIHTGRQLVRAMTELYFAERAAEALDAPAADGLSLTIASDVPAPLADYLSTRLSEQRKELGGRPDVRIAAHFALDTAYGAASIDSLRARDPEGIAEPFRAPIRRSDWRVRPAFTADGVSCVIAVTLGSWSLGLLDADPPLSDPAFVLRSRRSIDAPPGLGPCGFVAAFGAPGRHVGAWLDSTDYTFARVADWSARHTPLPDSVTALAEFWGRFDLSGLACGAGKLESCRTALLRSPWTDFAPRVREPLYARGWYGLEHDYAPFAEHAPFLLSDLVHDVGPDAFARFWQSDLPLEEAFRQATGRELVEWTAAWARDYFGPVPHSPRVAGTTLLLALLGSGLTLGFAVVVNQRRRS